MQELGGSIARQTAKTPCSVYEWGLAGGTDTLFSVSSNFFLEFREFCEICELSKICEICELQETHRFCNHF